MLVRIFTAVLDFILVIASGVIMFYLRFYAGAGSGQASFWDDPTLKFHCAIFVAFGILVMLVNSSGRLYPAIERRSPVLEGFALLRAYVLATVIFILFLYLAKVPTPWGSDRVSRVLIVATGALAFVFSLAVRLVKRRVMSTTGMARFGRRNVAIVGASESGYALGRYLKANVQLGYNVCGFLDDRKLGGPEFLGRPDQLPQIAEKYALDEIIYVPPAEHRIPRNLVTAARNQGIRVKVVPEYTYNAGGSHIEELGDFFLISIVDERD